jgi:hypothetical protein
MKYYIFLFAALLVVSCEVKQSQMRQDALKLQEKTLSVADSLSKLVTDEISTNESRMTKLADSTNLETDTLHLAEYLACKTRLETLETLKTSLEDWKIGGTFIELEGNPHKTNQHFDKDAADQDVMNGIKKNAASLEDLRIEITTAIK